MSKNTAAVLLAIVALGVIFLEATAFFALYNDYFKIALAQLGLWGLGVVMSADFIVLFWRNCVRH